MKPILATFVIASFLVTAGAEADDRKLPRITAVKLAAQYKADPAKSDAMYKEKAIVVKGVIDMMGLHPVHNENYIVFKTTFDTYFVQCMLVDNDQNKKLFEKVKKGMTVSIKGTVAGGNGSVVLYDCEFVKR